VDTPFIIWPTNGLVLEDSHIQPWNNTAKVRAQWCDDEGYANLRLMWDNPDDTWVVVNVESYLAVNGPCDAFTEGGFLVGSINTVWVWVQASLNAWEWWNQPPTMLPPQATQVQKVLSIATSGGGFLSNLGGGSVDSESVAGMFDVKRTLFALSPQGVAVFEGHPGVFLQQ
jgi:hypothetical protein